MESGPRHKNIIQDDTEIGNTVHMEISGIKGPSKTRARKRVISEHSNYVKWSQDSKYVGATNVGNNSELLQLMGLKRGKKYEHTSTRKI